MGGLRVGILVALGLLPWAAGARACCIAVQKDAPAPTPMLRLGPADGEGPFGTAPAGSGAIDFSRGVPALPLTAGTARPPGVSMTFSAPTPIGGTASLSLTVRPGDGAAPPGSRAALLSGD